MIDAYFDARAFGSKGASFAVCIKRKGFKWTRTVNCGKITSNQSEIKAVEYILKSIKKQFSNDPVVFYTTGKYAQMMLDKENGVYKRSSRTNQELLNEVRKYADNFNNIRFVFDMNIDWLKEINVQAIRGEDIFTREEE